MIDAFHMPGSIEEAVTLLRSGGESRLMAGGTIVMQMHNAGHIRSGAIVSLVNAGLSGVRADGRRVVVGATTPLTALEDYAELSFLRPVVASIGGPTLRNMATVGGNLFAASPYGDLAACLVALDATCEISDASAATTNRPVAEVVGRKLRGEILVSLAFDLPPPGSWRYRKFARTRLNSGAVATIAAVLPTNGKVLTDVRIGLGGVAPTVVRAPSAERTLNGIDLTADASEEAGRAALNDIDPRDDSYASAWYRRRVLPELFRRALDEEGS